MLPKHGTTPHPGRVLYEEYLEPLGLTQSALADHLRVPFRRIEKDTESLEIRSTEALKGIAKERTPA